LLGEPGAGAGAGVCAEATAVIDNAAKSSANIVFLIVFM
jgi:hypothetical protein